MKVLYILVSLLFLFFKANAGINPHATNYLTSITKTSYAQEINSFNKDQNNLPLVYMWILLNDGCLHLARLNDPGYTDEHGILHSGYSLTVMGWTNYIGTSIICPPRGEEFC
jgi:hypothetical protein